MTGLEVVVGFLVAWVVRRARRIGGQADAIVDEALDAGMKRVHDLVAAKLGTDPALEQLKFEAAESGEVGTRTQARVRMSLEEAVESDPSFAQELATAVRAARVASGQAVPAEKEETLTGQSGSGVSRRSVSVPASRSSSRTTR